MALTWSNWNEFGPSGPYVDWDQHVSGSSFSIAPLNGRSSGELVGQIARSTLNAQQSPLLDEPEPLDSGNYSELLPIPDFSRNDGTDDFGSFKDYIDRAKNWLPDEKDLPSIPNDTIIVGVIDTGIPLGHNRLRDADGKTRILAAWQMLAEWGGKEGLSQPYLPFGRELYQKDIDQLLLKHGNGSREGWLDEQGFNTETGVLDMRNVLGHREVAGRFSHGAHVLDAAAGCDPESRRKLDKRFRKRVKVIAVNIPSSPTFGASGTFLDNFMIYAIQRISDLADAIWRKNNPGKKASGNNSRPGYPVVINIAFGKQAGSKDRIDAFPQTLHNFRTARIELDLRPVFFAMPVGNDNLDRCNAYLEPKGGQTLTLDWRISPEDRSSNFVDVWTRNNNFGGLLPIEITVVPPGRNPDNFPPTSPDDEPPGPDMRGWFKHLGKQAHIYYQLMDGSSPELHKFRFVICVAPTARNEGKEPVAPAGVWKIKIKNQSTEQVQCVLSVQTDQHILPGNAINLRSYFDDPGYQLYDDAGRPLESYSYPEPDYQKPRNLDIMANTPVRRHGTMNASAAHQGVTRVGGYRVSDGRPAPYSATGRGQTDGTDDGTALGSIQVDGRSGAPTAVFPTDDGPAHFGILAAGAANGSVVAMRGTSFASSQATRQIAETLLDDPNPYKSEKLRLFQIAMKAEAKDEIESQKGTTRRFPGRIDIDNAGGGRIDSPLDQRVSRTGR